MKHFLFLILASGAALGQLYPGSYVRRATSTFTANNCIKWDAYGRAADSGAPCGESAGEANTASNVGTGEGVYKTKSGVNLVFKSLLSASNLLTVSGSTNEVNFTIVPGNFDLSTLGGSLSAAQIAAGSKQGNGSKVQMFGSGTPATDDCAKFDANGNIVSAGAACGSGGGGANAVLNNQSNTYSTGIQDFNAATALVVPSSAGAAPTSSGRITYDTTANRFKVGVNGSTKTLAHSDEIGETNTASNAGSGVGVWKQKTGVDLVFKSILAGSTKLSVTSNTNTVDLDIVPANLDLATLGGSLGLSQIAAAAKQGNGSKIQLFGGGSVTTDDCAKFDASGNIVSSGAGCSGTANHNGTFTSQTSVTFTHTLNTLNVIAACYDNSGNTIEPANFEPLTTTTARATFLTAQTGRCVINGTGGPGGGGGSYTAGTGLKLVGSTFSVDELSVPQFITASTSLNFGSILQSACSELTMTVTGAVVGDSVAAGWPSTIEAGLTGNMFVSAADTVTVRLCKITSGSVDPADQAFRATIVRSF